jgi:hypothetical protein
MQKRASKVAVVKNKYWDGEREEEIDEAEVLKQKELEQKEDDEDTTEKAKSNKPPSAPSQSFVCRRSLCSLETLSITLFRTKSSMQNRSIGKLLKSYSHIQYHLCLNRQCLSHPVLTLYRTVHIPG